MICYDPLMMMKSGPLVPSLNVTYYKQHGEVFNVTHFFSLTFLKEEDASI